LLCQSTGKVAEAFKQLHTGRPQPVAVEKSLDQLAKTGNVVLPDLAVDYPRPPADEDALAAAKLLVGAKSPMIFVGSGALAYGEALQNVAKIQQAAVISNPTGKGILSSRHYLSLSQFAGHRLWAEADVVLAVGGRLQPPRMNWGTDEGLKSPM